MFAPSDGLLLKVIIFQALARKLGGRWWLGGGGGERTNTTPEGD